MKREATTFIRRAFSEERMLDNATLVVWSKGQMRGIRAVIKRMGLAKCSD